MIALVISLRKFQRSEFWMRACKEIVLHHLLKQFEKLPLKLFTVTLQLFIHLIIRIVSKYSRYAQSWI